MKAGMSTPRFGHGIKCSAHILVYSLSLFWMISSHVQAQSWVQIGRTIDASHSDFSSGKGMSLDSSGTQLVMASLEIMSHQSRHLAKCYTLKSTEKIELVTGSEGTNVVTTVELEWSQKKETIWLDNLDQSVIVIDQDATGDAVIFGFNDDWDPATIVSYSWQGFNPGWGKTQWKKLSQKYNIEPKGLFGYAAVISSNSKVMAVSSPEGWSKDTQLSEIQLFTCEQGVWSRWEDAIKPDTGFFYWGSTMAISGDGSTLAVGGFDKNLFFHFRIFQNKQGEWTQMNANLKFDRGYGTWDPCIEMSSDGNTIVLGMAKHDAAGEAVGEVRVYMRDEDGWKALGQTITSNVYHENFGKLVQLSDDGRRLAVLSTLPLEEMKTRVRIRMYKLEGELWVQVANSIDYDG